MQETHDPNLPADLLDRLVMDGIELERLTQSLIQSLDASDFADLPRGRIAVQLMEVLAHLAEAGDVLHRAAVDQLKTVAAALAFDPIGEQMAYRESGTTACHPSRQSTLRRTGDDLEPAKETVEQAT